MYWWELGKRPLPPDERALDFLVEYGFNFVRLPIDYRFLACELPMFLADGSIWKKIYNGLEPRRGRKLYYYSYLLELGTKLGLLDIPTADRFWTRDFLYFQLDELAWEPIDQYLAACVSRDLHLCINLHRAPGYCIGDNHLERYNLWQDKVAQDAFVSVWEQCAKRYSHISNNHLSFNLVNEPPAIGQYGLTRENHAALICRTVETIHAIDPTREIVIDGLTGGNQAMPELAKVPAIHSGRGYQPQNLTHYQATWWLEPGEQPIPIYPGTQYSNQTWDKDTLREYYKPWREVEAGGAKIHIGEFGCFNKTPNDVALRWFADIVSLFREYQWGYCLWEFEGPFGIINHGRPGAIYEDINGYSVDRQLLEILINT